VNEGLLLCVRFEPDADNARLALLGLVAPQDKLTHVQPVRADPQSLIHKTALFTA
jgi:hypothetical protein